MRNIAFALIASSLAACQTPVPRERLEATTGFEFMQSEIALDRLEAIERVCKGAEVCILQQQEAHSRLQSVWNETYRSVRIGRGKSSVDVTPFEIAQRDLKIRSVYGVSVGHATNENGDVNWVEAERNFIAEFARIGVEFRMCAGRSGWQVFTFKCPPILIYKAGEGAGPVSNSPNDSPSREMKNAKPIDEAGNQK